MNFHWQNLSDKPGGRQGSGIRHGRAWLRFGGYDGPKTVGVNWEWVFGGLRCGISARVARSEENGFGFSIAIPLLGAFYLTVWGGLFARLSRFILRNAPGYGDREVYVRVHDAAIWWTVWRDPWGGWDKSVPRWQDGCFHVDDFLLGKARYSQRILSEQTVKIALPEASYDATVKIDERTWKRPRWFTKRLVGSQVDIPKGIPFPGKGENSWDCGEDAIYSQSSPASTVEDAVASVVKSVLRNRRRYGGSVDWAPAERQGAAE